MQRDGTHELRPAFGTLQPLGREATGISRLGDVGRFEVLWASSQEGASLPTYLRYAAGAIAAIVVLVLALAPLASVLVDLWSQRDLESRSRLVFVSIKDYAARQLAVGGSPALTALFEQLTEDEKLLAVGYCEDNGELRFATRSMPPSFTCASLAPGEADPFLRSKATATAYSWRHFPSLPCAPRSDIWRCCTI